MLSYIVRRLLLIIPTLFGIMLINFLVVQVLPGGPVEQVIAELTGQGLAATSRVSQQSGDIAVASEASSPGAYRGAPGLRPQFIPALHPPFVLHQPAPSPFFLFFPPSLSFLF